MDLNTQAKSLIGKYVYTKQPKLVFDKEEPRQVPVLVKSISMMENSAMFIINGNLQISFPWVIKLVENNK